METSVNLLCHNNVPGRTFVNTILSNKLISNNFTKSEIYVYLFETLSWWSDFDYVINLNPVEQYNDIVLFYSDSKI